MTSDAPAQSAYFLDHAEEAEARATFAVIVDNEPGVLHRVVGLFSARGYNIESLTVAETDHAAHVSRITIVTGLFERNEVPKSPPTSFLTQRR